MSRRLLTFGAALLLGIAWAGFGYAQESKFAFFDMQAFLGGSTKAKAQQHKVQEVLEVKKASLEAKGKELMKLAEQLQKPNPIENETSRSAKEVEYQKLEVEYKAAQKDAQTWLQSEGRQFEQDLQANISRIVGAIRVQKKLTFIFSNAALISADDAFNITDEVIKAYDADAEVGKHVTKPKPPAGAAAPPRKPKP